MVLITNYQPLPTDLKLVPSNTWGGKGLLGKPLFVYHPFVVPSSFANALIQSLLKRFEHPLLFIRGSQRERVAHPGKACISLSTWSRTCDNLLSLEVIACQDVQQGSPAAKAGLRSNTDYIVAADTTLDDRDDLFALIDFYNNKPLRLYVYNAEDDRCREVVVTPNSAWGGEGSMGCGIGYGYLHRIPKREDRPPPPPPATVSSSIVVPVPMPGSRPSLVSPGEDGFAEVQLSTPTSTVFPVSSPLDSLPELVLAAQPPSPSVAPAISPMPVALALGTNDPQAIHVEPNPATGSPAVAPPASAPAHHPTDPSQSWAEQQQQQSHTSPLLQARTSSPVELSTPAAVDLRPA